MIIVAWRKAGELPKDAQVMTVRHANVKTTKAGIKFIKENPNKFEKDDELEIIMPGKKFKIQETIQIGIVWRGDKD